MSDKLSQDANRAILDAVISSLEKHEESALLVANYLAHKHGCVVIKVNNVQHTQDPQPIQDYPLEGQDG